APAPSAAIITPPDTVGIRYSPTRPGTTVASALETQPVSDVTPASTYTIEHGDTLGTIAKKNQLTKAELATANHLKTSAVLHVGQKLIIPAKSTSAPAAGAPVATPAPVSSFAPAGDQTPAAAGAADQTKHVVKPGETLGGIARKYGVRQGELAVANNITDPRKIQPGQELIIPARSSSKKPSKTPADAAKAPAADQDLDAGLKPAGTTDVPTVKIDDSSQPKSP
ncbi:MAG TPA: LysM peptidoglycan-binding domain-containing protein, partial [Opitutaceae bacterium]